MLGNLVVLLLLVLLPIMILVAIVMLSVVVRDEHPCHKSSTVSVLVPLDAPLLTFLLLVIVLILMLLSL